MVLRLSRLVVLTAALGVPAFAHAQPLRESSFERPVGSDPTWDGALTGAAVGATAMAGLLTVGYARCDAGCEAPARGPLYASGLGLGAASGAAIGWMTDRLHTASDTPPPAADSTRNGVIIGAALGAVAGVTIGGLAADRCGPFCNTPESQTYLMYGGLGTGAGAVTGWLIDKLHVAHAAVPSVTIRADRREKAFRMRWSF